MAMGDVPQLVKNACQRLLSLIRAAFAGIMSIFFHSTILLSTPVYSTAQCPRLFQNLGWVKNMVRWHKIITHNSNEREG
jgi:hypothetical protein